jgi:hypothetical protein
MDVIRRASLRSPYVIISCPFRARIFLSALSTRLSLCSMGSFENVRCSLIEFVTDEINLVIIMKLILRMTGNEERGAIAVSVSFPRSLCLSGQAVCSSPQFDIPCSKFLVPCSILFCICILHSLRHSVFDIQHSILAFHFSTKSSSLPNDSLV